MGHEFSGVVAQVGPEVRSVAVGDRVIGDPRVGCGACAACRAGDTNLCTLLGFIGEVRPGCFAEYVAMSASKLVPLPPDANLRDAAVVEPLAVAVHVMAKLAPRSDEELLILGAGPIGLLCTLLANRAGALVTLCDPSEERLRLGAALQPRQSRAEPTAEDESRYRVVIEAAGRDAALGSAVAAVRPGGRIGLVGIYEMPAAVDLTRAVGKEACLMGLSAYGRGDLQEAARLVRDPRVAMGVRRIVTHELPLKDAAAALARLVSGWTPGKVLLRAGGMP
jgi:2-desacetyl-2-hydroxyethyl bacteriochlorophyllide A dehydrogenase